MVVNRHYENVVSKVDPEEVARAVDAQQVPLRHTSCQGRDSDSGMVTVECRACTIALKPNSFGVQLTCYECQRGQDDKTCHHTLKVGLCFAQGPNRRQLLLILVVEEDQDAAPAAPDATAPAETGDGRDGPHDKCSTVPRKMKLTP